MNKIAFSLLIISTLGASTIPPVFVSASEVDSSVEFTQSRESYSKIVNKEALALYEMLAQNESEEITSRRYSASETDLKLPEAFRNIELLGNTNIENIENIYSEGNEKVHTTINLNKDTNTYSLFEVNANSAEVLVLVNNEEYTVVSEGENINMYTEYGEILPLLVTEHVDTPEIIPALINVQEEGPINILATNATTSFGREYGPFQKTNKVLIEVLGVISAGTAAASFKINHPVLGIISGITGIAGYVGDKLYKTFYINYWQSYATNNSTYVKQRENYFQYNNYTGFVKSRTWYFYLSQPI
jgi:tyrosyl-tRNA synthetase